MEFQVATRRFVRRNNFDVGVSNSVRVLFQFALLASAVASVALGGHVAAVNGYEGGYGGGYEVAQHQEAHEAHGGYADVYPVETANHYEKEIYAPQPYKFGYEILDEYGNKQSRHEVSDEHNTKKGSYSFTDAHGISRRVDYVADAHGFRATIHTNEPGTATSNPAGAHYISDQGSVASYGYH